MAEVIIMPKLGFNMSVGKLVKWYKNEGDPVTKGEPIFAIETDKTSIDIEATQDGVFRKKFIEEGDEIEVTLPIAIVGGADENIDALIQDVNKQLNKEDSAPAAAEAVAPAAEESAPAAPAAAAPVAKTAGGKIKITPRARRVAKENGLSLDSLEEIIGTGYQGGICERDILEFLDATRVRITPVARKMAEAEGISLDDLQGSGIHGKIMKKDVEAAIAAAASAAQAAASAAEKAEEEAPKFSPDGKEIVEAVPYSGVRKIIGDRLAESKFTAPHLYFTQKVNLEKLLELRKQVNAAQDRKTSVTDYIGKAAVKALQKYPDMNSSLIDGTIYKYKHVNLGIAVAAPTGLIVPVVREADTKSVVQMSKEAAALFDKARNGKLTPDEYTGGTFTISNLGMFGIENFTAIINPPEVGILAISSTNDEPVVITDKDGNKTIEIKPMMNITLTVDHRLIDGLLAAQCVTEIKRLLENPIELLV